MVLLVGVTTHDTRTAVESVVRMEFARLVAGLARYTGDVGLAEELAQDALVAALEQWPESGVPRNAGAWLMTVGKRRAIDRFRRDQQLDRKYGEIGRDLDAARSGEMAELRTRSPTTSTTTCCGSYSSRAIRCSRCKRESR